jgi:CDP-glycerol glycerophosphotransferase
LAKKIAILKQILINNLIRFLEHFFRKNYNYWIFGLDGGGGTVFSGNVWFLYEYVRIHHPEIKSVCLASSKLAQKRVKEVGGELCKPNSLSALRLSLKAGVCIMAHEMAEDFVNFSKQGTLKINLFHGVPLKKIQYGSQNIKYLIENKSLKSKIKELLVGYVKHEEYDFVLSPSKSFNNIMSEAFNNSNVVVTGLPRNDAFYKNNNRALILEKYDLKELNNNIVVTYLPTFRDKTKTDQSYWIFENSPEIRKFLKKENIVVLQKNHSSLKKRSQLENVYMLGDDIFTQDLLCITDILITDYSSCYIDFLHMMRPIIFYPYDLDEYLTHDRELYFDYYDEIITPGSKCETEEELYQVIQNTVNKPDIYYEKRQTSLEFFHEFADGRSSERVYTVIDNILNGRTN